MKYMFICLQLKDLWASHNWTIILIPLTGRILRTQYEVTFFLTQGSDFHQDCLGQIFHRFLLHAGMNLLVSTKEAYCVLPFIPWEVLAQCPQRIASETATELATQAASIYHFALMSPRSSIIARA